jgi:hypothetical protein
MITKLFRVKMTATIKTEVGRIQGARGRHMFLWLGDPDTTDPVRIANSWSPDYESAEEWMLDILRDLGIENVEVVAETI